jgi:carboxyl-terminal processing protease
LSHSEPKGSHFIFLPVIVSISIAFGVWLGVILFGGTGKNKLMGTSLTKFREFLGVIEGEYVDTINPDLLTHLAIDHILKELDPHSSYIPPEDIEISKTSLESGFEGIGIEFLIVNDSVQIISAIKGGPSDIVGIMPGDRIVSADGKSLTGNVTNKDVFFRLRGQQGSIVELEVSRPGVRNTIKFAITRARISSNSVEASFLIRPSTGYIKISKFSDNTYLECRHHLENLKRRGARSIIIDVRDNPGGYLDRATKLVDEFLPDNKLIVYTDGRSVKYDQQYFSTQGGLFLNEPLIVLVNEGSASASEILAGAIQDNDRGIIVGRRTFGKGLVQVPISLKDGSELRLTISRYYTPSGRCIQKPYHVKNKLYDEELENRLFHGELFVPDSIQPDKNLKYETLNGRTVYGGGGIIPDIFVPLDTLAINQFLIEMMRKNLFREFALMYYNEHKMELEQIRKRTEPSNLVLKQEVWPRFVQFTYEKKIVWPVSKQRIESEVYLTHLIKAYIARLVWGDNGYYQVLSQKDPMITIALRKIPEVQKLLYTEKKTNRK